MFRHAIIAIAIFALPGCELGPEAAYVEATVSPIPDVDLGGRCGGLNPVTCVTSCGAASTGAEPWCRDGVWKCDGGVPESTCPEFRGMCDGIDSECGYGYSCVASLHHPVPADVGVCRRGDVDRNAAIESCGAGGALTAAEFLEQRGELKGRIVKIAATLDVDVKCSNDACGADACCNTCVGNYFAEIVDPADPTLRAEVTVDMDRLACNGTTCDVACGPLEIGGTYLVWGLIKDCKGAERCNMLYMGSCLY